MPRNKELSDAMREQSRAAILAAARQLFAERGYFNCKVSDVAKAAKMSKGNVYWHFASKELLLQAVLANGFDSLGQIMIDAANSPGSSQDKLRTLVQAYIDFGQGGSQFLSIYMSLLGHGGAELMARLGFDLRQIGLGYHQSLLQILSLAKVEGVLTTDTDLQMLTMFFFSFFNGLILTYGTEWTQLPMGEIETAVSRLCGFTTPI